MSLFLDGFSPTPPPDLLEPARDPPPSSSRDSFENHLQRPPATAETSTGNSDTRENDDVANPDQSDATAAGQDDADDTRDGAVNPTPENEPEQPVKSQAAAVEDELLGADDELSIGPVSPDTLPAVVPTEAGVNAEAGKDTRPASEVAVVDETATTTLDETAEVDVVVHKPEHPVESTQQQGSVIADAPKGEAGGEPATPPSHLDLEPTSVPRETVVELPLAPDDEVPNVASGETDSAAENSPRHRHEITPETEPAENPRANQVAVGVEALVADARVAKREGPSDGAAEVERTASPPAATEAKADPAATSPQDRFTQQLMGSGDRTARATASGDVNQTRFVERVARAFRVTDGQGGTIKLRLHPPELGMLQVQLKLQGNVLTAKLEAETPAARALLVESLPVLRDRLAEQGVRIEQFDVDLMERQPQNHSNGTGENSADERDVERSGVVDSPEGEAVAEEVTRGDINGPNQQLNIIV